MFRIRRVHDDISPANVKVLEQVAGILREQFPQIRAGEIEELPRKLREQLRFGFQTMLFAAEGPHGKVRGFALALYDPLLSFCYLDWIAAAGSHTGRGVGDALYRRLREEAAVLGCIGIFFECLPDDPSLCPGAERLRQSRARLRFYERFGARPIAGTRYETPLEPGGECPPYLVFDDLASGRPLPKKSARAIVGAILEK
ncbi:MAG: GNAT family N-acetyltransferase, partial [Thermovirgaceae bacterium]